ncbi:MAG: hypothetical protein II972_00035 [Elusimicrobiaceae bacterium]|nr:hypothetical protein [Elusimicrobiaceae bacterium]MBQ6224203.1 hypothetical protein [Campylobacter sp.]
MIKKSIITIISLLCFAQVYAKDNNFKEFDKANFKTQLNLAKQAVEKEYLSKTSSIDAKIIALLNSFDAKLYKSIKSDVNVPPITKTKFSTIRSAQKKHEYIKHYASQMRADTDIAKKQVYFRKTAAILNYLKGYDRGMAYQTKTTLLNRTNQVVQKAKANDFKTAYKLAEDLSKDFYKYVKLS